ncbi:unnamed protein product [Lymnaea stagnalis]|uniref:Vesicular, overexpressed in cancer, prosurvival protein 1 n=1 Tax=Lymnaea stagnalis TaxID=6523 RepID=A0AAV2HDH6_LYMST
MARFEFVYFILSALFGTSLCEYCYYSASYIFGSYSRYSKYCPFGCCGTSSYQYCCVTNAGYIVAIVAAVIFCVSVIVTIVCCCRRRAMNTRMTTTTVVGGPPTVMGGPTTVINPHATYITPNGKTVTPPSYPSVMYSSNNYGQQVAMTPPYQPYPYPNQAGGVASMDSGLPRKQDNPFDPPSYSSPATYGFNS